MTGRSLPRGLTRWIGVAIGLFILGLISVTIGIFVFDKTAGQPSEPVPHGTYPCYGHEYGLLAGNGFVTFEPDGRFVDAAHYGAHAGEGKTSEWIYDPHTREVRFVGGNIERGIYEPAQDRLTFYLGTGISRAHAEGGIFWCQK